VYAKMLVEAAEKVDHSHETCFLKIH